MHGSIPPTASSPAAPLARLARWAYDRRRRVVGAWLALLVVASVAAGAFGGENKVDFRMPGSDSSDAIDVLDERMPEFAGGTVDVVYRADGGVTDPAVTARIDDLAAELRQVDHVAGVVPGAVAADGSTAILTVQLDETAEKMPVAATTEIIDLVEAANVDGLQVEAGGFAVQNAEETEAGSEGFGLLFAAAILLVAFGSALAMGLPIIIAVFALGVALAGVALIANFLVVPDFAVQLATMIGIGVGIDYALFVLNRYRSSLAQGNDPADAVVESVTTAGRAVLFAGTTVVIALFGLVFMGLDYLWGVAAATSLAVLVVMVASLTLLPALLGFAGHSIDRFKLPWLRKGHDDGRQSLSWRWSRVVQRRPWTSAGVALVILLALASPFTDLRFGTPDASNGGEELTSRRAFDLVEDGFGAGANGPLAFSVVLDDSDDPDAAIASLTNAIATTDGIATVMPAVRSADGGVAFITAFPTTGPQDPATENLVHTLRDEVVPAATAGTGAHVDIGGQTAMFVDESDYMSGRLPIFIAAVIALSFLLLMIVFRSLLVAVKAAIMNLLSIGAAYGVIALAADGGWFGGLFGIDEATPVPVWLPMMMFALLFGLSMDYEVFLLSRIREVYLRTGDNASAVADGLASTARVITAAAAIMVTVFGAFILEDNVLMKLAGLGLATAIFVDATIVRMVLVPATMELLGDRNWWMPRWLDRLLPTIDVEGEHHPVKVPQLAYEDAAA
ncbi:MAG TPA: MMPL family transporter [Acidimicrobiia bacterium]|nr:MMPL family transporter [Acidimicrobiia bacterium]